MSKGAGIAKSILEAVAEGLRILVPFVRARRAAKRVPKGSTYAGPSAAELREQAAKVAESKRPRGE